MGFSEIHRVARFLTSDESREMTAKTGNTLHQRLRKMIGDRFDYLGKPWIMVEILPDVDGVVLKRCGTSEGRAVLQPDAYGIPNRVSAETLMVPVSNTAKDGYSDDLLLLLEGRQRQ